MKSGKYIFITFLCRCKFFEFYVKVLIVNILDVGWFDEVNNNDNVRHLKYSANLRSIFTFLD